MKATRRYPPLRPLLLLVTLPALTSVIEVKTLLVISLYSRTTKDSVVHASSLLCC
jgi:hypothetical protein